MFGNQKKNNLNPIEWKSRRTRQAISDLEQKSSITLNTTYGSARTEVDTTLIKRREDYLKEYQGLKGCASKLTVDIGLTFIEKIQFKYFNKKDFNLDTRIQMGEHQVEKLAPHVSRYNKNQELLKQDYLNSLLAFEEHMHQCETYVSLIPIVENEIASVEQMKQCNINSKTREGYAKAVNLEGQICDLNDDLATIKGLQARSREAAVYAWVESELYKGDMELVAQIKHDLKESINRTNLYIDHAKKSKSNRDHIIKMYEALGTLKDTAQKISEGISDGYNRLRDDEDKIDQLTNPQKKSRILPFGQDAKQGTFQLEQFYEQSKLMASGSNGAN
tara:strand:- start:3743 stop:4741 length:999 start_codon:yes stop_codon:yes gene_type:complete